MLLTWKYKRYSQHTSVETTLWFAKWADKLQIYFPKDWLVFWSLLRSNELQNRHFLLKSSRVFLVYRTPTYVPHSWCGFSCQEPSNIVTGRVSRIKIRLQRDRKAKFLSKKTKKKYYKLTILFYETKFQNMGFLYTYAIKVHTIISTQFLFLWRNSPTRGCAP